MKQEKKLYFHFAASCCLLIFITLGYLVKFYPETLQIVDLPVGNFIRSKQTSTATIFFTWITKFGSAVSITLFLFVFMYLLWRKKQQIEIIWLFINSALIAGAGNFLIKFLFNRPRPSVTHLVVEGHSSFPSGHAMGSMLFYGSLIILLPTFLSNKKLLRILQFLLGLLIFTIGMSRIYLGVHYPTDIIGGYTLGAAWILGTFPLVAQKRFERHFRKNTF